MLSRSEHEKIRKSTRKAKMRSIFLRLINFVFKSYLYLGLVYFTALAVVSMMYKSYLHQEPPFDYQQYIQSDNELVVVLTTVITSFVVSGLVVLFTGQRKKPVKKVEETAKKRVRRRRPEKAA